MITFRLVLHMGAIILMLPLCFDLFWELITAGNIILEVRSEPKTLSAAVTILWLLSFSWIMLSATIALMDHIKRMEP